MKIYLLSLLLLFAFNSKKEDQLQCKDFKIGKFELIDQENNVKYIIHRGKRTQTEKQVNIASGEQIKETVYYKLKWKNDCEFNLMVDTNLSKFDDFDLFINEKGGLNMKIIKTQGKCVTIETSLDNKNPRESTSCKIE